MGLLLENEEANKAVYDTMAKEGLSHLAIGCTTRDSIVAKAQLKKIANEAVSSGAFDKDQGIDIHKMYNLWCTIFKEVE